jgi:hypothetical protein
MDFETNDLRQIRGFLAQQKFDGDFVVPEHLQNHARVGSKNSNAPIGRQMEFHVRLDRGGFRWPTSQADNTIATLNTGSCEGQINSDGLIHDARSSQQNGSIEPPEHLSVQCPGHLEKGVRSTVSIISGGSP